MNRTSEDQGIRKRFVSNSIILNLMMIAASIVRGVENIYWNNIIFYNFRSVYKNWMGIHRSGVWEQVIEVEREQLDLVARVFRDRLRNQMCESDQLHCLGVPARHRGVHSRPGRRDHEDFLWSHFCSRERRRFPFSWRFLFPSSFYIFIFLYLLLLGTLFLIFLLFANSLALISQENSTGMWSWNFYKIIYFKHK